MASYNNDTLAQLLETRWEANENPAFIPTDPISLPHAYSNPPDIEVAAFIAALIAWGNRKAIVNDCHTLRNILGQSPYDFLLSTPNHATFLRHLHAFTHRTLNAHTLAHILLALQALYTALPAPTLEPLFRPTPTDPLQQQLARVRMRLLITMPIHTWQHIPNPQTSAAKRLCLFLRWMVRPDTRGVDFGLWHTISPAQLIIPMDTHVCQQALTLRLLTNATPSWHNATTLTQRLASLCPQDPVKYDFALFAQDINATTTQPQLPK